MSDEIQVAVDDWIRRMNAKTEQIILNVDKGNLKSAIFCEGEAKKLAMERIYNIPVRMGKNGKSAWKRTGLYKASIGSGMDPSKPHTAIVFATVPYAKWLEYGTSRNPKALMIITDSIVKNREKIKAIYAQYIKEVTR